MRERLRTVALLAALCLAAPGARAACTARAAPGDDLQAAIDALPQDRRPATLCLAAGEYRLRGLVAIGRDHLRLRGAGAATVLRMQDGVAQPLLVIGDAEHEQPQRSVRDVVVERLKLVGAPAAQEFMPERPWLGNSAVVVRGGEHIVLRRLETAACRSACILTERDTREVTITGSRIRGAVWDGVSFNRTAHVRLVGNDIGGNTAAGITAEHLEDSEIRGNTIDDNGSVGVYLSDSLRNRFTGNTLRGNRKAGVFLACAVRFREPQPVQCWDRSMSAGNVFEGNRLERNEYGYAIGADDFANCKAPDWQPNLWRGNRSDAPNFDAQPERFGRCTRTS